MNDASEFDNQQMRSESQLHRSHNQEHKSCDIQEWFKLTTDGRFLLHILEKILSLDPDKLYNYAVPNRRLAVSIHRRITAGLLECSACKIVCATLTHVSTK